MAIEGAPLVVKIRLYLAEKRVTVVCEDGQLEAFYGPANFFKAQAVAENSARPDAVRQDMQLDGGGKFGTILIVPPAVEVERVG